MTSESEPVEPGTAAPEATPPIEPPAEPVAPPAEPADAAPASAPPRKRRRLLSWLGYVGLAALPAVIVGLIVFFVLGGGDDDDDSAILVDAFLRLGTSSPDDVFSYLTELPPGYPADMPEYPGADLIAAFFIPTQQGGVYLAFYASADSPTAITRFYEQELDEDPWQVEGAQRGIRQGGLAFNRPGDIDVEGSVTVRSSDLGERTSVIVQIQDRTPESAQISPPEREFVLPASMELPSGFPEDIEIYSGANGPSTITSIAFQRTTTSRDFLITFLTEDDQDDVVRFYQEEFERRGWTVSDANVSPTSFTLGIDFTDLNQELQGTLTADEFADDRRYTEVDLLVSVSPQRGRGN